MATFACPIGVIANYSALHVIPWLAVGTLLMVGATFGSLVCGWACPFGFLQDLVGRIPTPKVRLPGWLGLSRYAVLVGLVLLIPYYYGEDHWGFVCRLCPAGAVEASVPYSVQQSVAAHHIVWPTVNKTIILAVFVVAMLFTLAALVYALLPAGGDLQPVQLRVVGVPAVPAGPVQRLRACAAICASTAALRSGAGAICGASVAWSASTAKPCRSARLFSRGKAPRRAE